MNYPRARRAAESSPEAYVTTTARRAMPERRGRALATGLVPWLVVGLGLALGAHGATMALWVNSAHTTLAAQTDVTGFSVQRDGAPADVAIGPGQTEGFSLTKADAQAIAAADSQALAIGFTVNWMTSGTNGLDYQISLDDVPPVSFLSQTDIEIFPQGAAGCGVGANPGQVQPNGTGGTVAVAPIKDPRPVGTPGSQAWCLVATFKGAAGQYYTEASATGTNGLGQLVTSNQAPWSVAVGPDPADQPAVAVNVTYVTTKFVGVGK
ncbi:MAG: hypothetical protein FWF36_04445 [Propionibacteriaceae bacterium]|nr:hypothetical protein [Propionibacteriaceae bacterium]